jgi:ribonucleoside-triphosphate reductase (thioredoxin)
VFDHFDEIGGLSFLPYDGGIYEQAPYEAVEDLTEFQAQMPESIDWGSFVEDDDLTEGSQELACSGGVCEWDGSGA